MKGEPPAGRWSPREDFFWFLQQNNERPALFAKLLQPEWAHAADTAAIVGRTFNDPVLAARVVHETYRWRTEVARDLIDVALLLSGRVEEQYRKEPAYPAAAYFFWARARRTKFDSRICSYEGLQNYYDYLLGLSKRFGPVRYAYNQAQAEARRLQRTALWFPMPANAG